MKFEITKIFAMGTYKRWMWITIDDTSYCIRIPTKVYNTLRKYVPTSQSLRGEKNGHK